MFCPGCGAKIDDGARFCPVCGQQIHAATAAPANAAAPAQPQHVAQPAPAAQPVPAAQPQPGPAFAGAPAMHTAAPVSAVRPALSITRIIPCALAIIAIILSFMPWFSVSPTVVQASSYASQGANFLSQLAGQSTDYSSSLGFDDSYNVWGLGKAGEVAVTYQSMYDSASDLASSLSDSYYGDAIPTRATAVSWVLPTPTTARFPLAASPLSRWPLPPFGPLACSPRSPASYSTSPRA